MRGGSTPANEQKLEGSEAVSQYADDPCRASLLVSF